MTCLVVILITKGSQPNIRLWLHKLILQPFRSTHSKIDRNIIPDRPVVERPPLPTAILPSESMNYLPTARMFRDIGGTV